MRLAFWRKPADPPQVERRAPVFTRPPQRRGFAAADTGRLFGDWGTTVRTADADLRRGLRALRVRSRDLSVNNPFAARFIDMVKSNVVGPRGIMLQVRAKDERGVLDKMANDAIEAAWEEFQRARNFSVCGTLTGVDGQRLFIESVARDGEMLVVMADNPRSRFGFSLQFIEADHLDEDQRDYGRNRIDMGVEYEPDTRRPVAYHILTTHPGEDTYTYAGRKYRRVPADRVLHCFVRRRRSQSRGYPWLTPAMTRLQMLGGYEEAELVAARTAASKMGFFTSESGEDYQGDGKDAEGVTVTEASPGTFEQLPTNVSFQAFDPQHPTQAFPFFVKAMLRGIASGIGVSYCGLANDLEGVNYSSIRQGALDERDQWRTLQGWMIDNFLRPVFEAWLVRALASGALNLPPRKFEKFNRPVFIARGWQWVDPLKEVEANKAAVRAGFTSRETVVAAMGVDLADLDQQLQAENLQATALGLVLDTLPSQDAARLLKAEPEQ